MVGGAARRALRAKLRWLLPSLIPPLPPPSGTYGTNAAKRRTGTRVGHRMVVYAAGHRLITIRGVSQGTADRWGIGIRCHGVSNVQPTQAEADALVAPIRTWFTSTGMFFPLTTTVDEIKLAPIGTDGLYPPGLDSAVATIGAAITGTTSSASFPPQCSLVISLTTALPRGRGHIGRVYLPAFRSSFPLTNGKAGTAEVDGILTLTKTMLNAIAATAGVDNAIVASPLGAPIQDVIGLRGGLVIDTQRRRRNDMTEDYRTIVL